MPFPFEVPFDQVQADLDIYVNAVFACLQSEFMTLPKGPGFVEYPVFEQGYEELKRATRDFRDAPPETVLEAIYRVPVVFIVLRTILGFTPPEWAYVSSAANRHRSYPRRGPVPRSQDPDEAADPATHTGRSSRTRGSAHWSTRPVSFSSKGSGGAARDPASPGQGRHERWPRQHPAARRSRRSLRDDAL